VSEFTYIIFGLRIKSPLEIPELTSIITKQVDVNIIFGNNPSKLENVVTSGALFETAKEEFLLKLPHIGTYYVKNGNIVIIDANEGVSEDEIRLFLLGSVLGAILYQRGLTPLHGSAVDIENKALLIIGNSAAGKSTLAAVLNKTGFPLISDDLSAITKNETGRCVAIPGLPYIKLWKDSAELLFINPSFKRVRPQIKKFIIPSELGKIPVYDIQKIIWLTTKNSNGIQIHKIAGAQKLKVIRDHLFRDQLMKGLGLVENHFSLLTELAKQVSLFHVERPILPFDIEALRNRVINEVIES
jgi:energy-coupling factor transporter ATP-binding protein EcfA2